MNVDLDITVTRAQQILGWNPEIQLEEGLRRMLPTLGHQPADHTPVG